MRMAELCAGYSGLNLSLLAAGYEVELAWYAENDPDAAAVMAHHHPGVPNLGDITAVAWRDAEPVDVLAAGYPCQDLSNAGKRAGIEGERSGIWRNVADAVRVLRPRLVCLENVASHLARGFGRVLGDLAAIGYDATWLCLRASDLGAPHRRDRVFIVAHPADADRDTVWPQPVRIGTCSGEAIAGDDREGSGGLSLLPTPASRDGAGRGSPGATLAADRFASGRRNLDDAVALLPTPAPRDSGRGSGYTDESGRPLSETVMRLLPTPRATDGEKGGPNQRGSSGDLMLPSAVQKLLPTPTVADSRNTRNATANRSAGRAGIHTNHDGWTLCDVAHAGRWGSYTAAIERWERVSGRPAPEPTSPGRRGAPRLSASFVEWLMGLPGGYVTDVLPRNAALRVLGNGLVPIQGAAAYRALAQVSA